jgi:hypothetical protein
MPVCQMTTLFLEAVELRIFLLSNFSPACRLNLMIFLWI